MGPDYELGLRRLRVALLLQSPRLPSEFELLETRLLRNLQEARLYGDDPASHVEWSKIMAALISLTNEQLRISFNDLCHPEMEINRPEVPLTLLKEQTKGRDGPASGSRDLSGYNGTGNRWAVLVGVDAYKDRTYRRLRVCTQDLSAISQQLSVSGFAPASMYVLSNHTSELPTRENILTTLKAIALATKPEDLLLFYYTGHGDIDEHESYLVANDGRFINLEHTAVAINQIKKIMQQSSARAKVLILDACHGGAAIGTKGPRRMSPDFIQRVFEQAQGIAILSSCMQNQVSYEWQKQSRSVFTYYLLEALQGLADNDDKGFVTVADIHRHVSNGVIQWATSNKKPQTPTFQAEMAGDIIVCYYEQKI
jgi:hypothetical protein